MPYAKYNLKDNAYWNILAGIGAGTTTINLESWDGARFPTSNFIATLVKYTTTGDDTTPILASEKILVVSRSTDTTTVTRWFDGDTPTSFDAGDNIYLNVVSSIIEDIQDEVTRLESDKLDISDFNSTLRNNLGNWKVIYTNGTWDETELTLWSSGQFLKSNGATSAPTWEAPTVDINWLTEDNDALDTDDMLVYYDWAGNKKRKAKATTTQEWLAEMATDAEATTGTDEERYINSKQLKNRAWFTYGAWWATIQTSSATVAWWTAWVKLKEIRMWAIWGIVNVSVEYQSYDNTAPYPSLSLYKNGSLVSVIWANLSENFTRSTLTYSNLTVSPLDYIQIYHTWNNGSIDVRNLRIIATPIPQYWLPTVIS